MHNQSQDSFPSQNYNHGQQIYGYPYGYPYQHGYSFAPVLPWSAYSLNIPDVAISPDQWNCTSNSYYPYTNMGMSNLNVPCAPVPTAMWNPAFQVCYYGGPTYNYFQNGHLGNTNTMNLSNINLQAMPEKKDNLARKWTGELQENTEAITDYLCRFELQMDMFRTVANVLKKLFRGKIHVIDDIPLFHSPNSLFVYIKATILNEFISRCNILNFKLGHNTFKHPEKDYQLEMVVKGLNLPYGLQYGKHHFKQRNLENQLYVDGLSRMFCANDLLKIYDDLYKNVQSVRVFSDKNGYPNKSAVVLFRDSDSFHKALHESPIMVKTSTVTAFLRNKKYEPKPSAYFNHSETRSATSQGFRNNGIRRNLNGNHLNDHKSNNKENKPDSNLESSDKESDAYSNKEATQI